MKFFTLKRFFVVTLLMCLGIAPTFAGGGGHNGTHYGKVTVTSNGNGSVYIGTSNNATSGNTTETWDCGGNSGNDTKTYYLFAKPDDGYVFAGWTDGSTSSTDNPYEITPTATSTTQSNPTTFTYTAKFNVKSSGSFTNPVLNVDAADPTVLLADDGYYYMCCSEHYEKEGLPLWRSADMINWEKVTNIFPGGNRPSEVGYTFLWAPELTKIGDKYVLYFANAAWGSEGNTQICVATSNKPYGPYTFNKVLFSAHGANNTTNANVDNCIDPSLFIDGNKKYMVWGSWHGIYYWELTDDGLSVKGSKNAISSNTSGDWTKIEAPMIIKRNGYYYLIASKGTTAGTDNASNINYRLVMARSTSLSGTWYDPNGTGYSNNVFRSSNTMYGLLESNDYVLGPGHCSQIVTDKNGTEWIFYHGYSKKADGSWDISTGRKLFASKVEWSRWVNGWPGIMPPDPNNPIDMPVIPDEAKDKQNQPEIETVNFANGFLPAKQFNSELLWSASTWVALSDVAYGNDGASSPNFNVIQGTPANDASGKAWYAVDYQIDNEWESHFATFSDNGTYKWAPDGKFGDLYFRRYFKVEGGIPDEIYMAAGHDDSPSEYYLNGELIWSEPGTKARNGWEPNEVVKLTDAQKALLKNDGTVNILAVHVHQNWGGYLADAGLYKDGTPKTSYDASRTPVDAKLSEVLADEVYGPYLANAKVVKEAQTSQSIRDNNDALAELKKITVASLDETTENQPTGNYDALIVNRSFWCGEWNTFCVPFDMEISDLVSDSYITLVKKLVRVEEKDGRYSMVFNDADKILAGESYLVWIPGEINTQVEKGVITLGSADVEFTSPKSTSVDNVIFQGVYDKGTVPNGGNCLILNGNKFYVVNGTTSNIMGFRGYFVMPESIKVPEALSASFDDDNVTGITSVNNSDNNGNDNLYNIAGQRVNENAKGIIIKNGKKYLVK